MSLADLSRVKPFMVPAIWKSVRDMVCAAYLRTDLGSTVDLERDILSGNASVWIAHSLEGGIEAAAVTKFERTNRHRVCVVVACGGSRMSRWVHHLATIEHWAKAEGAHKTRIFGRKGWARKLENYRVSNVVLERSL